jgi:hypothetical protein
MVGPASSPPAARCGGRDGLRARSVSSLPPNRTPISPQIVQAAAKAVMPGGGLVNTSYSQRRLI